MIFRKDLDGWATVSECRSRKWHFILYGSQFWEACPTRPTDAGPISMAFKALVRQKGKDHLTHLPFWGSPAQQHHHLSWLNMKRCYFSLITWNDPPELSPKVVGGNPKSETISLFCQIYVCMYVSMSVFILWTSWWLFEIVWYESCVSPPCQKSRTNASFQTYSEQLYLLYMRLESYWKASNPPNSFSSIMHLRWVGSFLGENCIPCGATYQATLVVFC